MDPVVSSTSTAYGTINNRVACNGSIAYIVNKNGMVGKISNFAQDGSFTGSMPISDLSASSCQCADVVSTTGGPASPPAGAFYPDFFFAWGNSSGVYCGGYPTNNVAQISSDGYASEGMYFV